MALFSRKNTAPKTDAPEPTTVKQATATDYDLTSIILHPRVTEKAVALTDARVYTFMVRPDATKYQVRDAVKALYSVTPVKVNIVKKSPRKVVSRARGRVVAQKGYKKAYVYLKAGDSINLV